MLNQTSYTKIYQNMGQKPSSVEDLTSLSKKELKVKSKKLSEDKVDKISLKSRKSDPQMTTSTRKKSDSTRSIPTVASEKQQQQQQQQQQQTLECAISTSPAPSLVHSAEQLINNAESESEKKNTQADNDADSSQGRSRRTSWPIDVAAATAAYSTEPLSFSLNPRIAELGHLTAWQMMQNFENLTKVDNYLRSQVSSFNATMEDNISEKSIGSGYLPEEQADVTANDLERHSATCTAIDIDLEPTVDGNKLNVITAVEQVLVAKEEQEEVKASMPKAVVTTLSTSTTSNDGKYDEASKLRSEVIQLKEGIDKARYERDEARLRLRVAEERCEAYETESRYLEATLDSMEEKIRDLARELSAEVMKSRTLEQQLSLILSNSTSSKPKLQQTDKVA